MSSGKVMLILGLIMLSFVFAKVITEGSKEDTKETGYTVERTTDDFEIREYQSSVVATVTLPGSDYDNVSRQGFRKLANYIFGGNEKQEEIAMTSPVMMELGETSTMHFFMPEGYDLENLPVPNNGEVVLEELESKRVAVIAFGGWANQQKIEMHQNKLVDLLDAEGIAHTDRFFFMGYNAPFEMTNRRNEVVVELK